MFSVRGGQKGDGEKNIVQTAAAVGKRILHQGAVRGVGRAAHR